MIGLLGEVNKTVNQQNINGGDRFEAVLQELESHVEKINTLQTDLAACLEKPQTEDTTKITSESYRTGFDSSHINKAPSQNPDQPSTTPELLNPNFETRSPDFGNSLKKIENEEELQATPTAIAFGKLEPSDYRASHAYIASHPEILRDQETDDLLMEASRTAVQNEHDPKIRQFVHQGTLLQYCCVLGRDGVFFLFERMTTPDHNEVAVFRRTVAERLQRILELAKEHREAKSQVVEHIQIHAVEPGAEIVIRVPEPETEEQVIFEQLTPEMRLALESGSLDRVNKVLQK